MNTDFNMSENNPRDVAPEHIARLLTHAALRLDDGTVAALRRARDAAVERQLHNKPALALSTGYGMRWLMPQATHQWVAMIILLVAMLFGGLSYWQHIQENDLSHLDVSILTDDLPLEVFVD